MDYNQYLDYEIYINGSLCGHPISSITISSAINTLPWASVAFIEEQLADGKFMVLKRHSIGLGDVIQITLGKGGQRVRCFEGYIQKHRYIADADYRLMEVVAFTATFSLAQMHSNQIFGEKTLRQCIQEAVVDLEKPIQFPTSLPSEVSTYIQYDESIWHFLTKILHPLGFCLSEEVDTLEIIDLKAVSENIETLQYGRDIIRLNLIEQVLPQSEIQWHSWDLQQLERQKLAQQVHVTSATWPLSTIHYRTSGFYRSAEEQQCKADALHAQQELASKRGELVIYGRSDLRVGVSIEIKGLNTLYKGVITGVTHSVVDGEWLTRIQLGEPLQVNTLAVIPPQVGLVQQVSEDPLGHCRIQVALPLFQNHRIWVRPISPQASKASGLVYIPQVGDEALIGFDAHQSCAFLLGYMYSSTHTTDTYDTEAEGMYWMTPSGHTLTLNAQTFQVNTKKGMALVLSDEEEHICLSDNTQNQVIMNHKGITFDSPEVIQLKGKEIHLIAQKAIQQEGKQWHLDIGQAQIAVEKAWKCSAHAIDQAAQAIHTIKGQLVKIN